MMKIYRKTLFLLVFLTILVGNIHAQRKMQKLGRGVIATHTATTTALVSWRLLATEPSDIGFNVYRSANGGTAAKLNTAVLTDGTNFTDATADFTQANTYFVKTVLSGLEQEASATYTLPANTPVQTFFNVPIHNTPGYAAKFIWVGDLDGDGEFDFVFDKQPTDASKNILLEAYKRDGTFLWQVDCGPNSVNKDGISPGSSTLDIGHGDNFTVYDINNDGLSEVIVRTANGVKFGDGAVLSESDNNKQFISVLNGITGAEISRTPYNNPYLSRGPMNGHIGIAYLDGINPSVVWEAKNRNADNSFNEMTSAWNWTGGTLVQAWQFLTGSQNCPAGHQIRIADVDGDGKDEVIPFGFVIDHDGTLLNSLGPKGIVHGDRFSIGDLDPNHPGLEGYNIEQINPYGLAWVYWDAKSGDILNSQTIFPAVDMARGMSGDFDPRYPGYEFFTFTDALYNVSGAKTSTAMPSSYPNLRIWWDGDLLSENLDNGKMTKWNYLANREDRISMDGHSSIYGVIQIGPNTPGFYGDILGDWREEIVYEASDHNSLVVLNTPFPTTSRIYTLSQNPEYRASMCLKGYYQQNMVDYYLGYGMLPPPISPIQKANKYWVGTSLVWDNSSSNWLDGLSNAAFANGDTVMFDIRGNNSDTIKLHSTLTPARVWAMNPQGKDYTISGTGKLSGAMDLIKAQNGIFTLCGNYDYNGTTKISEGTLKINGSLASNVLVQAKGNLGGVGKLNGGVTLEQGLNIEGGRLSPGNGAAANLLGSLTIQGNLVVPGNNNFAFDIIPGSPKINDSINVLGDLTFNGVNKLVLNVINGVPGIYTLISCTGTLTATPGNFALEGLAGVPSNLIIEDNKIKVQILNLRVPRSTVWKGSVDNIWNFSKTNFDINGVSTAFTPKDTMLFDETGLLKTISLTEIASQSGLTFNATSDYTIDGTGSIAGAGGITKLNNNTLSLLSSNNSYTGKTLVNGGTLTISTLNYAGFPSSLGYGNVSADNIEFNNITLNINNKSVTNRGMTIIGSILLNIPVNSYAVFGGTIQGSGNLIKDGPGQLGFINRNTFTGGVVLRNGSITLGSNEANADGLGTGPITIENGSVVLADARLHAAVKWGIIIPAGKTGSITMDGNSYVSSSLTGAGTLTVTAPYVRTDFQGNWSAFTGKINTNGDFRIDNNFGYANAAVNIVTGVAYTKTNNNAISFGELSGAVGTSISGGTWTIGAKNTDATFAGKIKGNVVTKVGTGTWTLTDTSFITAATTINGGKINLLSPGYMAGSVIVNNGGTIGGTGKINGTVTIAIGGKIAPGNNAIGTLTINNTLTLSAGSYTEMEIDNTSTNDLISSAGTINLNGTLRIVKLDIGEITSGKSYKLFNAATIKGNFSSIEPAIPAANLGWDTTALRTSGTIKVTGAQSITFDPIVNKTYGDNSFNLTATATSGLNVTYTSSNPLVATISGSTVTIVGAGTTTITASQTGNASYLAATDAPQSLTVNKASQTITFTGLPSKKVGDAPFSLTATSSSGLPVSYESGNINVATINGSEVTILGAGTANITALQAGNNNYNAALNAINLLDVTNTSVNYLSDLEIVILPNPVADNLTVTFNHPDNKTTIDIYSLTGIHLYSQKVVNKITNLMMGQFQAGLYIIKVTTSTGVFIKQIIKQ